MINADSVIDQSFNNSPPSKFHLLVNQSAQNPRRTVANFKAILRNGLKLDKDLKFSGLVQNVSILWRSSRKLDSSVLI